MKKRFILSGYYGFKNFGDEAILSLLVKKIQSDRGIITVISADPQYTKSLYSHIRAIKTFDFSNIIPSIYKSDILISGGGSLLQDVTSLKSLIYYLLIIFTALLFRKKVIIFAQGIGPIKSFLGQCLTKLLLKNCDYISVRDKKSHEILQNWGIKSDLLCDPIFGIKIPIPPKNKSVAIQLRNCKTMNNDFLDRLADSVSKNFADYTINIYPFQDSIDLETCRIFEKNLNILNPEIKIKLHSGLTNSEIVEHISKSEYLIAMRFHAVIIGLLAQVKTLGINYDIKVEKLAKEFNIPLIDMKNDFSENFSILKSQDLIQIKNKISQIKFDWAGFEKAIK